MTRLATMIRIYVAMNGIQAKSLAKSWGCSPSTVTRFLKGEVMPDARTVIRIISWCIEEGGKQP